MSQLDEIKQKIDIVELIASSGVNLRKAGRTFVGFCPFHPNTRTPAFTVYPDSQSFHCFGCKASGTAFDYVMRKQGLEFREALEQLAQQAGVQLVLRTSEDEQQDQFRTRLLELNAAAARYFNYLLVTHRRGEPGREYVFGKRGLDQPTVEAFQLGYSFDEWSHLLNYLTERKGFTPEEVVAAGLAIQHESRGFYDRFRGRVIFPIRNSRGDVVGFGGRALGEAQPKYLNSPQTILFDKSAVLYGLDLAREAIRSQDASVVVEGYLDVITAHQYGFRNVVAPLGTALTKGHVGLLKKLAPRLMLALDADAAGQRATMRGLSVIAESEQGEDVQRHTVATAAGTVRLESEVELQIIKMPEGRDPDEVIRNDPEHWRALVAAAVPVMDFYLEAFTAGLDPRDSRRQAEALAKIVPLLAELDSANQRVYISKAEQRLGLRAELIIDALRELVAQRRGEQRQAKRQNPRQRPQQRPSSPKQTASATEEKPSAKASPGGMDREAYLLSLHLHYPMVGEIVSEQLHQELVAFPKLHSFFGPEFASLFERSELRALLAIWQNTPIEERPLASELGAWAERMSEPLRSVAIELIAIPRPRSDDYRFRPEAERLARQLRLEQVKRWKQRLIQRLNEGEAGDDPEELGRQMGELFNFEGVLRAPRRSSTFHDLRNLSDR